MTVLNVTKKPATPLSGRRVEVVHQLTLDTDYAAGGYSLTAAMLGLSTIDFVSVNGVSGFVCEYDYTASKVKVLFGDNNNAADGPLIEVADGADAIANLTCRVLARGVAA